jgi:hypothetical protein
MQESDVSTFGRRMTSKHRVRTSLMTIKELEDKLSLKMIEKLGREVQILF